VSPYSHTLDRDERRVLGAVRHAAVRMGGDTPDEPKANADDHESDQHGSYSLGY
jgi:hypothetical protein